jgi:hypothetical protein
MNDERVYLDNLHHTFPDKAWFLRTLPFNIDTIVDYGCADGSFMKWLARKHDYRFIGVESNQDFLAIASMKGHEVYPRLDDVDAEPGRTVLVLNSVLHEVCSYSDPDFFWYDVRAFRPACIAIRDMNIRVRHDLYTEETEAEFRDVVNTFPGLKDQYNDFRDRFHGSYDPYDVVHFLMKYFHRENWSREYPENYNALEIRKFVVDARYSGYDVVSEKHFLLPYLWKRWLSDFGGAGDHAMLLSFLSSATTHVKMFLKRTKEADE